MGIKEDLHKFFTFNDDSDYSIQLSSFAMLNLWLMVFVIVFMIGICYCCHCCYRNKMFNQRIADLESMQYDDNTEQEQDDTNNSSIMSENMELRLKNDILQRQLSQSLEQIKEFKGLDHEYSSVINDLEKQLNNLNDNLFHKDQIITALMHKMQGLHYNEYTNTNTSIPNSRMLDVNKPPPISSASGTEHGINVSMELTPPTHDQRIKQLQHIDTTATTTNISTSLEVHMDQDMDIDNLDITVTPLSGASEWKSYMVDSKEEEEEEEEDPEKEIGENDITITMEDENVNNEVAIVTRKKYKVRRDKDRTKQMSYITQTPSRTMSAQSINEWESNSLEKAPSHDHDSNKSISDLQSHSHSNSSTHRQLEIQLRSYVMKENEWFYEKKNMEKEIGELNEELKTVQNELQGFKAFEYSDKQHDLIMGIITNYAKR